MCLLAILSRVVADAPLIVGANREEEYARGGAPPQILPGPVAAVGGRDPLAGGTWLAVNAQGVLVAVTNRPKEITGRPLRSRGLLVRDLLACATAPEAVDRAVGELARHDYAGCSLLCADVDNLLVVHAGDWPRVRPLPPGIHVLANGDVNSPTDARVTHSLRRLRRQRFRGAADGVAALQDLCGDDGGDGFPAICLHGQERGTTSSSIIVLRRSLDRAAYLHAQGPPDDTPYVDCSDLLRTIAPPA